MCVWWEDEKVVLFTSEVFIGVAVVGERDPHPGHLLGDADVCVAIGAAEGVWVAVLRVT